MKFLDLKQLQIIDTEEYVTMNLNFDGGKILDSSLKEAKELIDKTMRINYKNRYIFMNITVYNLQAEKPEFEEDEFESVVTLLLSSLVIRNLTTTERLEKEKNKIMNRLTSGAWIVSSALAKQVKISTTLLRKCGDFKPFNKGINIHITQTDGDLLYRLLDKSVEG